MYIGKSLCVAEVQLVHSKQQLLCDQFCRQLPQLEQYCSYQAATQIIGQVHLSRVLADILVVLIQYV